MATFNISSNEDFIDIILTPSSPSHILPCPNSPCHNIDFEFRNPNYPTFNHDDEFIYKSKLLPLFVPPCHQTGQETLHGLKPIVEEDDENDLYYSITFHATCSNEETTLDEPSCHSIYEVNDESVNKGPDKKPSWIKKAKFVVVHKMKAMKSLFPFNPMCAGGFCDKISFDEQSEGSFVITKQCSSMSSTISSSSSIASSCTSDIDGAHEARFMRSSSDDDDDDDETECSSVDAAVAYCKKSLKILNPSLGYDFENMLVWMY